MRLSGLSTALAITLVGTVGVVWDPAAATAAGSPSSGLSSTVVLAADADVSTPEPDLAMVAPGGTLTLTLPALLDTSDSTASLTDAAGATHPIAFARSVDGWEIALPQDLPDGTAFVNLDRARLGQTPLPSSIPLGIQIHSSSTQQVSSRVRILAAAHYNGTPLDLLPGRPATFSLASSDLVVRELLSGAGPLTAGIGPRGAGSPFEARVATAPGAAPGELMLTLPQDYPASQVPGGAAQVVRLDATHPVDPDIAFVTLDVPVRLIPRYSNYVTQSYLRTTGRRPTAAELATANRQIENARNPRAFASGLVTSAAFRTQWISAAHRSALGRAPRPAEVTAQQRVAAQGGLQAVETSILASNEFYRRAGSTTTGYVRAVSRATLGRNPSASESRQWVNYVTRSRSRTPLARALTLSDAHARRTLSAYQSALTGHATSATTATLIGRSVRAGGRWESHLAGWLSSATWMRRAG